MSFLLSREKQYTRSPEPEDLKAVETLPGPQQGLSCLNEPPSLAVSNAFRRFPISLSEEIE